MKKHHKILLYAAAIILFCFALMPEILNGTPASPAVGNWYQQFMPNIGSQQLNDIIFLDSLNGFAISSRNVNPDTSSILRTTNGGDTWQIIQTLAPRRFSRIKFVNSLTGFISGGSGSGTPYLYKTIDAGNTWSIVTGATLGNALWGDMSAISNDTIWLTDANSLNGGVYRTTNGGVSWDHQINLGSSNPEKIYMYNGSIGYITKSTSGSPYIRKTTDSGISWSVNVNGEGYRDIYFSDINTGWRGWQNTVYKTTNSGLNWLNQAFPAGGNIITTGINEFSGLSKDTIFAVGGEVLINSQTRGIVYRTINGGLNWQFQIPDTAINVPGPYNYLNFTNSRNGWAYTLGFYGGIHTTTGGDPIWLTGIELISSEIPTEYRLYQNYPNPFNPKTIIRFQINILSDVNIRVYDLQGKLITELVNQKQNAGTYQVDWNAVGYSSGVYFYTLLVNGKNIDTKKLILIK